jgi:hypothetical protein
MIANNQQPESYNSHAVQPVCSPTDRVLDELESILGDISAFLQGCYLKFEQLLSDSRLTDEKDKTGAERTVEASDELSKQTQSQEHIRQQVALLMDAWLRLENEQRILLQTKQGLTAEFGNRVESQPDNPSESILQRLPGCQPLSIPAEGSAVVHNDLSVVHDFEKLRREIELSRPSIKPYKE